ncbi:MAG TPA: hypothetical protein VLS25_13460, partial [Dehalococcoidia bacterium]|nr:hypothetical protein [Dehalococcoidia bacterium]
MLRALAVTLPTLALIIAACGGGGSNVSPTPAGSPTVTAEPTLTASPAAPEVEPGVAVLIALGDSGTYACCGTGVDRFEDLGKYI